MKSSNLSTDTWFCHGYFESGVKEPLIQNASYYTVYFRIGGAFKNGEEVVFTPSTTSLETALGWYYSKYLKHL